MKSFLKIIGGSLIGFLIGVFLLAMITIGIISNAGKSNKISVEPNSILRLDLSTTIPDRAIDNPLANLSVMGFEAAPTLGLFDLKELLEHAAGDDKIKGLYLTADLQSESFAALDQLRRSLEKFKASGKFILAYNTFSTQKSYLLSTVADELIQHPSGYFEFDGLAIETRYYKKLLDKLEVEPIPLYAGEYKSASEPYRLSEMSEANRRQLHALLEDLYADFMEKVIEARGIPQDSLESLMNGLKIVDPDDALRYGLVDRLAYEDEVFDALREKMGFDNDKKLAFVSGEDYQTTLESANPKGVKERIAVVYAEGEIVLGEGSSGSIGGEKFMKLIRKLRKDDKIKAIVLRVNSPGGVAISSDKIWRELKLAREEKPLVVSMGNYAASGGYMISAPADKIFAERTTLTGSIGVVGILLNLTEFFEDKLGVTFDRETIGEYADFGNLTHDWSEREKEAARLSVRNIYLDFKQAVAEGRKMTLEEVEEIAQGRVWTGQDAIDVGLVDSIGGLDEALAEAAKLANLEEYRLREYPEQKGFIQILTEDLMSARMEKKLRKELGSFYDEFEMLRDMEKWTGVQMRMPFEFTVN